MDNVNSVGHSKTEGLRIIYLHKRNEKNEMSNTYGHARKKVRDNARMDIWDKIMCSFYALLFTVCTLL